MRRNELGEESPIPKSIQLKIQHQDSVKSLINHEEGEFKMPIGGCINVGRQFTIINLLMLSVLWTFINFQPLGKVKGQPLGKVKGQYN